MSTPNSIRNVSWAVVRAGTERRHAYRKAIDIHLNGSKISEYARRMLGDLVEGM